MAIMTFVPLLFVLMLLCQPPATATKPNDEQDNRRRWAGLETGAASLEPLSFYPPVRPFSFTRGPVRGQHRHGREKEAGLFRHLRLRQGRGGRRTDDRATGGTRSSH